MNSYIYRIDNSTLYEAMIWDGDMSGNMIVLRTMVISTLSPFGNVRDCLFYSDKNYNQLLSNKIIFRYDGELI